MYIKKQDWNDNISKKINVTIWSNNFSVKLHEEKLLKMSYHDQEQCELNWNQIY